MSPPPQGIAHVWPGARPVIGVVHLPALPGAPRWAGSMDSVVEAAVADAEALSAAGFDGVIVENFSDVPFHAAGVPPETVAAMTRATLAVRRATELPVGLNVLRNDAHAALAIAAATGARFVRVNVHTGSMWTDQGLVHGRAAETMRLRSALAPDVALLADVRVKHAVPPVGSELGASARDTWLRGLADALIVSGGGTGEATAGDDLLRVRAAVPEAPLLVGSGLTPENAPGLLAIAAGAIVGSAIMEGGRAGRRVDPRRAGALLAAVRAVRSG